MCFNQALLAKQAWRILSCPNLLLSRVLLGKYCQRRSFLDIRQSSSSLWGWRSILWGRSLLASGLQWVVGNGQRINPFEDQWIPIVSNPCRGRGWTDICPGLRVAHFIDPLLRSWRLELLKLFFPAYVLPYIVSMHISQVDIEDKMVWGLTKSGEYSVKSGYKQALTRQFPDHSRPDPDWQVWKRLWKIKIPPKWILFVWKCLHNIIPVKIELKKRGMPIDIICSRCFQHAESLEHLFFDCPISQRIWRGSTLGLDFGVGRPLSFFSWFQGWVQQIHDSEIVIHSIAVLWAIWMQRNSVEFHKVEMSIEQSIMFTSELLTLFISPLHNVPYEISHFSSSPQTSFDKQVILQTAKPCIAAGPRMRIVVDGSWVAVGERTGLAWVRFDSDDHQVYEEAILGPSMLSP